MLIDVTAEYIWKSKRLEKKINVRHRDLVKKAITQTNTNMFYINRTCVGANGRVRLKIDHCHTKETEDFSRGLQSPEYHLAGPARKLLLKTSQLQCGGGLVCPGAGDTDTPSSSPPASVTLPRSRALSRSRSQTSSVPDITR